DGARLRECRRAPCLNRVRCDRHADVPGGRWPGAEELDQRGAAGDTKDEPEGKERKLAGGQDPGDLLGCRPGRMATRCERSCAHASGQPDRASWTPAPDTPARSFSGSSGRVRGFAEPEARMVDLE